MGWSELLFGFGGTLLGAILGNWFAIGRENRSRFRNAVDPVRLQIINSLESGAYWQALSGNVLGEVRHILSRRELEKLRKLEAEFAKHLERHSTYEKGRWIAPSKSATQEGEAILIKILDVMKRPWWQPW